MLAILASVTQLVGSDEPVPIEVPLPFEGAPHFYQMRALPELGEALVLLEAPLGGTDAPSAGVSQRGGDVPTWSPDLADAVPLPILLCDLDGAVLAENQEATSHRQRTHRSPKLGSLLDWFEDSARAVSLAKHIRSEGHANIIAKASGRVDSQILQVFGHRLSDPGWDTSRLLVVIHVLPQNSLSAAPTTPALESRDQWRQVVEDVAPLAFELSARGRVIFFTRSCSPLFDLSAARLGGARLEHLGFEWDAHAQSCLAEHHEWTSALLTRTLVNGEVLTFETSGVPSFDDKGKFKSFQIVGRHDLPTEVRKPARQQTDRPNIKMPLDYNAKDPILDEDDGNLVRLDDWRSPDSPSFLSEEEFASIVGDLNAALLGLDEEGRIHFANRKAGKLLDHDPEDLDGHRISSFFEKGFGALLGAYFSANANSSITKTFHEGVTATLKLADGKTEVVSIRLHPLREKSVIRYCALLQPDRKSEPEKTPVPKPTSEDLPISEKESDFLALVSHEIRTPLNAILGFQI